MSAAKCLRPQLSRVFYLFGPSQPGPGLSHPGLGHTRLGHITFGQSGLGIGFGFIGHDTPTLCLPEQGVNIV